MNIEYEATFANIGKDEIRGRLKAVGAELVRPEFMQKRVVLDFPTGHEVRFCHISEAHIFAEKTKHPH